MQSVFLTPRTFYHIASLYVPFLPYWVTTLLRGRPSFVSDVFPSLLAAMTFNFWEVGNSIS